MHNGRENLEAVLHQVIPDINWEDSISIKPIRDGGNNRVYTLEISNKPTFIIKQYFSHYNDPHDRFSKEWIFLRYATSLGVSRVPKPILCNKNYGITIMEYVYGQKLHANQLDISHINQALDFFDALNKKPCTSSLTLPNASESCFNLRDHIGCVEKRIPQLDHLKESTNIDHLAKQFVQSELIPLWKKVQNNFLAQIKSTKLTLNENLSENDICISPSDFGFHNAIKTDSGFIIFIDFEYAGRDDPVKMISDFFCQPKIPVPPSYLPRFSRRVLERLDNPEEHYLRLDMVLPVHTIKWCCIILNEFLPLGKARRLFACNDIDIDERKNQQLKKARILYEMAKSAI